MKAKFKVGDKVRYNRKVAKRHMAPQWVLEEFQGRTRTVVEVAYNQARQRNIYWLGGQGRGQLPYGFVSHQLVLATDTGKGRPREKRRWSRKQA